ncbi:unnamed protein product [Meganyctiphanes norvegica]|uniref:Kinesin-like protein n=1 Tax=Meganyctiphanes norvegica TaxID=48144 RepID=A0AAV2S9L4_MEGNR
MVRVNMTKKRFAGNDGAPSTVHISTIDSSLCVSTQYLHGNFYLFTEKIRRKTFKMSNQETVNWTETSTYRHFQIKPYVYIRLFKCNSSRDIIYYNNFQDFTIYQGVVKEFHHTIFFHIVAEDLSFHMKRSQELLSKNLDLIYSKFAKNENKKVTLSMGIKLYLEVLKYIGHPTMEIGLKLTGRIVLIKLASYSQCHMLTNLLKIVMRLLTKGNKERTCEPTAANKTSSRSHALLQVNVQQTQSNGEKEETRSGRLYMIDLAGSERAKQTQNQGKRLREGAHINRSLLALGNCINALAEGRAKYVNFRDSKLTRLLKDALSGNCRTVMVAHASPAHVHREETRNTLIYADRAKNISNKVRRNVADVSFHVSQYQTIITELKDEISRLKEKIDDENTIAPSGLTKEEEAQNTEKLRKLKNDLLDLFREQMSLRCKLMDIDNNILDLSMEFERQNLVVTEYETEKIRRDKLRYPPPAISRGNDGEIIIDENDTDRERDEESDEEEPEEIAQAWEDLIYLQKEQQRYTDMREKVEQEMSEVKKRANEMEEALPRTITNDEQKELLSLLCKVHELEIQKVEMQSEALLKEHELRRRDLLILRYDRQRNLCEEIIHRQRTILEEFSPTMPPELQELYSLYQMETQYSSNDRDVKYLNDLNNMLRSPSMLSLRAPSLEKLPPINNGTRNQRNYLINYKDVTVLEKSEDQSQLLV